MRKNVTRSGAVALALAVALAVVAPARSVLAAGAETRGAFVGATVTLGSETQVNAGMYWYWGWAANPSNAWIRFDLLTPKTLSNIRVYQSSGNDSAYTWGLYYSTDGGTWTQAGSWPDQSGNTATVAGPISARYWQIKPVSTQSGTQVGFSAFYDWIDAGEYDSTPPATPAGLAVNSTTPDTAAISWTANTDPDLSGYRIYRNALLAQSVSAPTTTATITGLTPATTYTFTISAVDTSGNESAQSLGVNGTTKDGPPATPTGLAASPVSPTGVHLTWNANTEPALTKYRIYRDGAQLAEVSAPTTFYDDTGLTPATTYNYSIAAIDSYNQASGISADVLATTPDASTPSTPTGLAASLAGPNAVALTWTANPEPDIAKYRLYRDGIQLTEVAAPATGYTDSTVQQGQTYLYAIAAVSNFNKASSISADVPITVPDVTPPAAPTGLTATATYATAVDLTWTANLESDLKEYRVYRNGSYLATVTAPAHSMTDTTAAPATMYSYEVSAVDNADNESTRSNLVSATTPEATASTPPPTPTGFTATASTGSVRLAWSPAPTAQSYTIWRNDKLLTTVAAPAISYTDPNLQKGTYSYTIAASNAAGSSVPASTQATLVIGFFEWTIDLTGLTDKTSLVLASLGSILLVILGLIVGLGIVQYIASRAREVR